MVTDLQQSKDFLAIATTISQEFAKTAVERDARGGTPTEELDRLRDSGLLSLVIPQEYGGWGETWFNALKVVREISQADGSLGQLLGYHYGNATLPRLFGTPEQNARFSAQSASHKWFWGDAVNPRDPDLILTPDGDNFRLNGVKKFCTGAKGSDVVVISGIRSDLKNILFAILPSDRQGTESHTNHIASLFQIAWDKGGQLTAAERGEVAVAIASAKVLSTKVRLNVTSKIFEVMGARAGASKYGFDRYWRNLRTHTLHDPIVYKVHEVGNWVLNKQIPSFTLYT